MNRITLLFALGVVLIVAAVLAALGAVEWSVWPMLHDAPRHVIHGPGNALFSFRPDAEIINDSTFEQLIRVDIVGDGSKLILNAQAE